MIDPQGTAMTGIFSDGLRKPPVSIGLMSFFVRRRESPVLPAWPKLVRRRSDSRAPCVKPAIHPEVSSKTVGRQSQIMIDTDLHTAFERPFPGPGKLHVHLPLQKLEEPHALPILLREVFDGFGFGVAKLLRP